MATLCFRPETFEFSRTNCWSIATTKLGKMTSEYMFVRLELVFHRDIQALENVRAARSCFHHYFLVFGYPGERLALVVPILLTNYVIMILVLLVIILANIPNNLFSI